MKLDVELLIKKGAYEYRYHVDFGYYFAKNGDVGIQFTDGDSVRVKSHGEEGAFAEFIQNPMPSLLTDSQVYFIEKLLKLAGKDRFYSLVSDYLLAEKNVGDELASIGLAPVRSPIDNESLAAAAQYNGFDIEDALQRVQAMRKAIWASVELTK